MKMCCAWLTNSGAKGSPKISGSIEPWWLRHKSGSSCSGKKRVQIQGMYIDYGTTKNHIALFWIFLFSSQLIVNPDFLTISIYIEIVGNQSLDKLWGYIYGSGKALLMTLFFRPSRVFSLDSHVLIRITQPIEDFRFIYSTYLYLMPSNGYYIIH